ncbi:immunity 51 family protein [Prevotella intermedia]|jgi:hypothetical protein|uniref:Immunity protein 51 n=1 Tax=Prevotella intermedia TaxID=28131 RepID=A0A2M8TRJ5_PREIN|nr:immunity 51 family protein [Prevotella intermedia]PJI26554.1 hypothetical protein CTM58_12765 [Prevotella intermedia]
MDTEHFKNMIAPFFGVDHKDMFSVCLNTGEYKHELFETREEEGFEGNGYDWCSLVKVFLKEYMPELKEDIQHDPEAGMYCAYSSDADVLRAFIIKFREVCDNETLIYDLFSRAEIE